MLNTVERDKSFSGHIMRSKALDNDVCKENGRRGRFIQRNVLLDGMRQQHGRLPIDRIDPEHQGPGSVDSHGHIHGLAGQVMMMMTIRMSVHMMKGLSVSVQQMRKLSEVPMKYWMLDV